LCHWKYKFYYSSDVITVRQDVSIPRELNGFFSISSAHDIFSSINFFAASDTQCEMVDPRNSFSTSQINVGYFHWFPRDRDNGILEFLRDRDYGILGLLGPMRYDVYDPLFRQSRRIAGAPKGQNDSEYEQSEN